MFATIAEVARELSIRYHARVDEVGKGKKGTLWLKIVEDLFEKHGEKFGCPTLSSFKKTLRSLQKKKTKGTVVDKTIEHPTKSQNHESLGLGEGLTTFTQWQIKILGLNPDSY